MDMNDTQDDDIQLVSTSLKFADKGTDLDSIHKQWLW